MADRRPYASRGVPRRPTTRWAANRSRRWPRFVVGLLGGVLLLGLAVACVVRPFAAAPSPVDAPLASASVSSSNPDAPATSSDSQSADTPSQLAQATFTPTAPLETTRQWDENVPGVINDPALAARLDQALVGVDGHVGVAVKDLGSGRGAVLNGDMELQSASLYKLPVLYTVFDLGLNMSEPLTITDDALQYDSGTMELGPGETLTVAEALERMVTLSDNTSAVMLGTRVGAGNVDASIAALGMDTTHYSLERMTTSALDMLHFLSVLASGQAVSPGASSDMLHLMLRQRVNDRLPRLLPDEVQVAHKTGNLPGVVNDVGILYGPKSTVAVAALVSDTTDEVAAATAIAEIGLVANSYFEEQPEVTTRPLIPPPPSRPIPPVWREPHPVPPTPTPEEVVTRSESSSPTAVATAAKPTPIATVAATATTVVATATSAPTLKPTPPPPAPTATHVPPPPTATPVRPAPTKAPAAPATRPPAPTATLATNRR